jgi:hypothetical protein
MDRFCGHSPKLGCISAAAQGLHPLRRLEIEVRRRSDPERFVMTITLRPVA